MNFTVRLYEPLSFKLVMMMVFAPVITAFATFFLVFMFITSMFPLVIGCFVILSVTFTVKVTFPAVLFVNAAVVVLSCFLTAIVMFFVADFVVAVSLIFTVIGFLPACTGAVTL